MKSKFSKRIDFLDNFFQSIWSLNVVFHSWNLFECEVWFLLGLHFAILISFLCTFFIFIFRDVAAFEIFQEVQIHALHFPLELIAFSSFTFKRGQNVGNPHQVSLARPRGFMKLLSGDLWRVFVSFLFIFSILEEGDARALVPINFFCFHLQDSAPFFRIFWASAHLFNSSLQK